MRRLEDSERGRTVRVADELNDELSPAQNTLGPLVPQGNKSACGDEGRLSAPVLNWMRLIAGAERFVR